MKILSIYSGHNSSVGYFENGQLLYILQEEKFDNIKNSSGFPIECIKYLAKKYDLKTIDKISIVNEGIYSNLLKIGGKAVVSDVINAKIKIGLIDRIMYVITKYFPKIIERFTDYNIKKNKKKNLPILLNLLSDALGYKIESSKLEFVEHHVCHALSPIYFYGLYESSTPKLICTLDGSGDRYCATVRVWKEGKLETLATTRYTHSLGYIWSNMTNAMGMKALEHEYKVMGLAAYTSEKYFMNIYNELLKGLIWVDGLEFKSKVPLNRVYMYFYDKLYGKRFDNIAGALQYLTENVVCEWIKNAVEKTGIKEVAFSGGVFMNVKLNKKIQELDFIDKVYFMPSCGDESNVIGALFSTFISNGSDTRKLKSLKSMFFGLGYEDKEVENFIKEHIEGKYLWQNLGNDEAAADRVAELLSKFEIVAVARGKGERGARSLCNRAILSNASDLKSFFTVNDMIKMRDFWMPFAPTMLEEWGDKYIKNRNTIKNRVLDSSYYMITAFDGTDLAQQHLRAAMHQKDKTLRPQMVNEKTSPWMYSMLKKYEALTGMGGVMNTSLNIHGYPLVGTMEQSLFTFENSGLKHIMINNILISKK